VKGALPPVAEVASATTPTSAIRKRRALMSDQYHSLTIESIVTRC